MEQKKTATAMGICNCKLWVRPAAPAVGEAAESPTRTSTRRITGMAAVYWGRGLAPRTEVRRATARARETRRQWRAPRNCRERALEFPGCSFYWDWLSICRCERERSNPQQGISL